MNAQTRPASGPRGQMLVLFALSLTAIVLLVGLVIDGGNGLVQRRGAQNASDFAALAGARIVAEFVGGDLVNGTDGNVQAAINNAVSSNGGDTVVFGAPDGPVHAVRAGLGPRLAIRSFRTSISPIKPFCASSDRTSSFPPRSR